MGKLELIDLDGCFVGLIDVARLPIDEVKVCVFHIPPTTMKGRARLQSQIGNVTSDCNMLIVDGLVSAIHQGMIEVEDPKECFHLGHLGASRTELHVSLTRETLAEIVATLPSQPRTKPEA